MIPYRDIVTKRTFFMVGVAALLSGFVCGYYHGSSPLSSLPYLVWSPESSLETWTMPTMSDETLGTIGLNGALIKAERLVLRTYHAGMVTPDHVRWLNDPEVVKYSEQRHTTHTLESQHTYVNNLWSNPGSIIWAIMLQRSGDSLGKNPQAIGTITAHCDIKNRIADMGIMIGDKTQWKKGYGLEAWSAVIDFLFKHAMRKITAGCMSNNTAMLHLCLKSGMRPDGCRLDHLLLDGKPVDVDYYARFA